jgi:RNase H-fold protein (predicted Holliday junction resolvase)
MDEMIWDNIKKQKAVDNQLSLFDNKETMDITFMPDILNYFSPSDKRNFPYMKNVKLVNNPKTTISGTIFKNEIGIDKDNKKYQILIYSPIDNIKFTKFDLLVDTATRVLWKQHIENNGDPRKLVASMNEYMDLLEDTNSNKTELRKYIENSLIKFSNINFIVVNFPLHTTSEEKSVYFNMSYFDVNILENGEIRILFNDEYIKNMYETQKIFNYNINELKKISSTTGKFLYRILKQFEDETDTLVFDIFELSKNLLINYEGKKGYEIFDKSYRIPLKQLKELDIIKNYKYKQNKIAIMMSNSRIIKNDKYYFYIQTYNELKENLVKKGKMMLGLFEKMYKKYGNKKLSIFYEIARANVLYNAKNKNNLLEEVEISKLLNYFYQRNEEIQIKPEFSFILQYNSLGYKKKTD